MKRAYLATVLTLLASTATFAAETATPAPPAMSAASSDEALMAKMPGDAVTVTDWYKQSVYDPSSNKIGEIVDVLVDKGGRVSAVIISVGGFLGVGSKLVAVPYQSLQISDTNLVLPGGNKDALKTLPEFKYASR